MKRALSLFALVLLSSCRGCAGPEAPNEEVIERLVDPYTRNSGAGTMLERAREVLDDISGQLGYGTVPGDLLARRAKQPWAVRLTLLLSHGGTAQLATAWEDVRYGASEGFGVPVELKKRARQAQSRVLDLENTGASEQTLRRAYLAEIAWILVLQAQEKQTPDAD